ncbi:hypothetical protein CAOG_00111 [Capsaspora owczarzaki ATCC 30864]|uniref:Polycystin cation channel PKD1/PKD2 domain-containing protein n=1 Tax=Capsaspora owczarzaki (strain ATCC 30864) TaxID=595528 RepID=A0A0D2VFF0_CAPO3|nr:hypothetical protein CAOG_00111 [Capsaspora owczarzaki ATCC 30864]KJE88457.1 hypothetical protein CAOG_000111 [Capsaspora owczarzaki ATCC 30864]|eukprot:XP_004364982.2 hypothetical protein CAOG_00111 [Capsaspora owczarzaki ATCC 30864]
MPRAPDTVPLLEADESPLAEELPPATGGGGSGGGGSGSGADALGGAGTLPRASPDNNDGDVAPLAMSGSSSSHHSNAVAAAATLGNSTVFTARSGSPAGSGLDGAAGATAGSGGASSSSAAAAAGGASSASKRPASPVVTPGILSSIKQSASNMIAKITGNPTSPSATPRSGFIAAAIASTAAPAAALYANDKTGASAAGSGTPGLTSSAGSPRASAETSRAGSPSVAGGQRAGGSSSKRSVFFIPNLAPPRLSKKQQLTLSPWTKFTRFKRIPFKFILNVLVTALLTTRILLENGTYSTYVAHQHETFHQYFRPDPDVWQSTLFSMTDVTSHLTNSVNNYAALTTDCVSHFSSKDPKTGHTFPIVLTVQSYANNTPYISPDIDLTISSHEYTLTQANPIGPFFGNDTLDRPLFDNLYFMTAVYNLVSWQTSSLVGTVQFTWRCEIQYDLTDGGGVVSVTVVISKQVADTTVQPFFTLDLLLLLFAICSLLLTIKALFKSYKIFMFARRRLQGRDHHCVEHLDDKAITWSRLSLRDKSTFFNTWYLATIIGDIMVIVSSLYALTATSDFDTSTDTVDPGDLTTAIGILCGWLNLIKFLEWRIEFYMLILAVRCSIGRIARFIITALPVFLGFALAGVALFSELTELFGSLDSAAVTLFAVINGDSVLQVFTTLDEKADFTYRAIARVYMYTFCVLFITAIINVFIFIIEDGYRLATTLEGFNNQAPRLFIDNVRLREILTAAQACDVSVHFGCDRHGGHLPSSHTNIFDINGELLPEQRGARRPPRESLGGNLDILKSAMASVDDLEFISNRSGMTMNTDWRTKRSSDDDILPVVQPKTDGRRGTGSAFSAVPTTTAAASAAADSSAASTSNPAPALSSAFSASTESLHDAPHFARQPRPAPVRAGGDRRPAPGGFGSLERMYSTDALMALPGLESGSNSDSGAGIPLTATSVAGRSSAATSLNSSRLSQRSRPKSLETRVADAIAKAQEQITREVATLQNEFLNKVRLAQSEALEALEREISVVAQMRSDA